MGAKCQNNMQEKWIIEKDEKDGHILSVQIFKGDSTLAKEHTFFFQNKEELIKHIQTGDII